MEIRLTAQAKSQYSDQIKRTIQSAVKSTVGIAPGGDKILGGGVIVQNKILTVAHLWKPAPQPGATAIITPWEGKSYQTEVVQANSDHDIALCEPAKGPSMRLEDNSALQRGEPVIAIGFPGSGLKFTATVGVISGFDTMAIPEFNRPAQTYIITDVALGGGNSGGPIIRPATGNVIGLAGLEWGGRYEIGAVIPAQIAASQFALPIVKGSQIQIKTAGLIIVPIAAIALTGFLKGE